MGKSRFELEMAQLLNGEKFGDKKEVVHISGNPQLVEKNNPQIIPNELVINPPIIH